MGDIEKITALLEDVSIGKTPEKKEEFVLLLKTSDELSDIDTKTVQLLDAVREYEELKESYRLNYINGFLTLSRANYNSGLTKKYGMESFDLRPYEAVKTVTIRDNEFEVKDRMKQEVSKEPKVSKPEESIEKNETTLKLRKKQAKQTKNADATTLALDLEPKPAIEEKDGKVETKLKNPLNQFGGIVPYQLKQSQQYFAEALDQTVKIKNMETQIHQLILQIEAHKLK